MIVQAIEKYAAAQPNAVAVWYQKNFFTYQDLQTASVALAQGLQANGVTPGTIVAVGLPPGFDFIVALIAIFRCRAVYLPLDPEHPPAHTQRILAETRPRVVIREVWEVSDATAPVWAIEPAYVMYTSGTTGQPKGVVISSDNLNFYLRSAQEAFQFRSSDIFCNVARATFSISLFDLLLPFTVGASVRLLDRADIFDRTRLSAALAESTVLHAGPSLLSTLFRYGPQANLRHVSTGGDLVLPHVMEGMKVCFPQAELFVIYGTTEISCMGTYLPLEREQSFDTTLVGKPFPGVGLTLIDGEICFTGPGIGVGYFQQPAMTAERFSPEGYRTGDFGRFDAEGRLEMLGRRDFQVQLRGVRIELTGIENHILQLGIATHCAVVHQKREHDSGILVGFLAGASTDDPGLVRRLLGKRIPAEMVPARLVFLPKLPTTFNGKLDRRQMIDWPLPTTPVIDGSSSDLEATIHQVLRSCLDIPDFHREQNFFEAGGHSLLAIHVLSELNERHGIQIPPAVFFQRASARELASYWRHERDLQRHAPCHMLPLNQPSQPNAIFLVAGAPIYRPLAQALDRNWSAFALISEQECDPLRPVSSQTMEDLARDYADSILQQQRHGPYYILGYSFAGILAFEIARQLTAAGHEVKRLFLLDATLPESIFRWRHRFLQCARLLRTPPSAILSYLLHKLRRVRSVIDPRTAVMDRERGHRNRLFAQDYMKRMPRYAGEAVLFVAGERLKQKPLRSRSCGWRPYLPQLKVITTPGDHHALIQDPECLQQIIREIRAAGA